jgi:hypothetical protein
MHLLQQAWDKAHERLRACDRLVVVGYSVPDADVLAKQMLRTAVRQNASLECVECINTDPSVAVKIREVSDLPVVRLYADIPHFLKYT